MRTYTPNELRDFAHSRKTNPFWHDEAVAALMYAANVLEAADLAVKAERERADLLSKQLKAATLLPVQPGELWRQLVKLGQDAALALPVQERNFCQRCGQRLGDAEHIHTCTPPLDATYD